MDVYVISLASPLNVSRREAIIGHFGNVGLKFQFFDATDASILDEAWISQNIADEYRGMYDSGHHSWLTRANLACADSHRRVARYFLESGSEYCMVFEDDVRLRRDFFARFLIDEKVLSEYKIVFLNHSWKKKAPPRVLSGLSRSYRLIGYPVGGTLNASGYVLGRDAAKKICDWQYPKIQNGADSWAKILGSFVEHAAMVWPRPVTTGYEESSIRGQSLLRRLLIASLKIPLLRRIYEERQRWAI